MLRRPIESAQLTALEVVTASGWRRAIGTLAQELMRRRDATSRALTDALGAGCLGIVPRGGYHLWASLSPQRDADTYTAAALTAGVAVTSGTAYYATGPALPHIRVSYVATASTADAVNGIKRLPTSRITDA